MFYRNYLTCDLWGFEFLHLFNFIDLGEPQTNGRSTGCFQYSGIQVLTALSRCISRKHLLRFFAIGAKCKRKAEGSFGIWTSVNLKIQYLTCAQKSQGPIQGQKTRSMEPSSSRHLQHSGAESWNKLCIVLWTWYHLAKILYPAT